jgi:hypothetical protein
MLKQALIGLFILTYFKPLYSQSIEKYTYLDTAVEYNEINVSCDFQKRETYFSGKDSLSRRQINIFRNLNDTAILYWDGELKAKKYLSGRSDDIANTFVLTDYDNEKFHYFTLEMVNNHDRITLAFDNRFYFCNIHIIPTGVDSQLKWVVVFSNNIPVLNEY